MKTTFLLRVARRLKPIAIAFQAVAGIFFFCCLSPHSSFAQAAGDYRTNAATMNWSAAASWQKYNGTTWNTATDYPGQNVCAGCVASIRDGHAVTLDLSPANSLGSLTVGSGTSGFLTLGSGGFTLTTAGNLAVNIGATLDLNTANLNINGATSTSGTITDASNSGINTFTGTVIKNGGGWTSTAVTTPGNMNFSNGVSNLSGSFTCGAATIGAGKTITATATMIFNSNFSAAGAINIDGNAGVTISGSSVVATIAGNLAILTNSSLNFAGGPSSLLSITSGGNLTIATGANLTLSSTGNLSVAGSTTINGSFVDNADNGTDTFTGLITNNGIFNTDVIFTANNVRIDGGFTNATGANFLVTGVRLSGTINATSAMLIDGTLQNNGAGTTTFASGTVTISGTSGVNFASLVVSSGATLNITTTGTFSVFGTTNIAGSFSDTDNSAASTFGGLLTVTGSCNLSALGIATLFINGGLAYNSGSFLCTGATLQSNLTTISNVSPLNFSNGISVTGGAAMTFAGPAAVTVGGSVNINFPVSLIVSGLLTFSNTGSVTVTAATTVTGTLIDNENTGITTFNGAFSSSGNVDFSLLSTSQIVFNGGVAHLSGPFAISTATISTDAVFNDIDVTSPLVFSGGVIFTGTGTLMVVGAGGLTFSGTSNIAIPAGLTINSNCPVLVSTTGNFTVNGAASIGGSFTDNENTGITTFTGLVTKFNGTWTSTAITTPANMIFNAGINQTGGIFNAGGASLPSGQTLNSNPSILYFNNPLVISGSGDLTISGGGGVNLAGTGINYSIPRNLTLTGTLTISTTGNFSVAGITSITGGGAFIDNNNTGVSSFTGLITHNSTGAWTSTAVTTAANMIFNAGYTNTAGVFSGGAATVGDNQTLTGTVNMNFANGVVVTGNSDLTVAGTSSSGVTFGGTGVNYTIRNLVSSGFVTTSTTGNLAVTGTASLTGTGGFLDNNGTGVTTFTGTVTVGATATFTANAVITLGNLVFSGGINQHNTATGAFSAGTIRTGASQTWAGAGDINANGVIDINIGTLTNNITGTVTCGGTLTGNIFIQGDNSRLSLASTTPLTIVTLISTAQGNTVGYRAAGTSTMRSQVYYHLTVSGSGNKIIPNTDLTINGDMTITSGVLSNANNRNISLGGNWFNNAGVTGFSAGTGVVSFLGTAVQILGGSFSTTFNNLTINNAAGINQVVNTTVTGTLNLTSGIVSTGNKIMIIASSGTVTRSSGHINGLEQKHVATGTNVTRSFEIGDEFYYAPATVQLATVTVSGNLIAGTIGNDHPEVDYSGIDSSKDINRYWSIVNAGIVFTTTDVTLNWQNTDLDPGVNTAGFETMINNGSAWTLTGFSNPLSNSIKATGVSSFGDFIAGEKMTSFIWTGAGLDNNWHNVRNWSGGMPAATYTTIIPNGLAAGRIYPWISSGGATVKSMIIQSNASVTVTGGTLKIKGNLAGAGLMNSNDGTLEYNGTTPQTISPAGLSGKTVKNLIINNNVSISDSLKLTGTLTINTGKTFTTNDLLIVCSKISGTARIAELPVDGAGNATAFIAGKVTVERYLPLRKAWRLLGVPLKAAGAPSINAAWQEGLTTASANANLYPGYGAFITGGTVANGFDQGPTSNPSIKVYNPATSNFGPLPTSGTNTLITSYAGYFIYVRGDRGINLMAGLSAGITSTTLRMKGEVNTGDQIRAVNASNYTVLGNPYASAIDFQTITKNNVKNAFYVWDPNLAGANGLGGYVTFSWNASTGSYDQTTAAGPASKNIPSGHAVLIESADGINAGTVTIKESDKIVNGNDDVFSRTGVTGKAVRIDLYGVSIDTARILDGALATYAEINSNLVDNDDAKKINGSGENISLRRGTNMLAIERRSLISTTDTLFLNLSQMKRQQYQLVIASNEMAENGTTAFIRDRYDNSNSSTMLNLDGTIVVNFTVNTDPASYAADRFRIEFVPSVVLPVNITSFKANALEKAVSVEWTAENVVAILKYEVERACDGRNFVVVKSTPAKAISGSGTAYQVIDEKPGSGNNFYRLRSVSMNGQSDYSKIVNVPFRLKEQTASMVVWPNPVSGDQISFKCINLEKGAYTLTLLSSTGEVIAHKSLVHDGTNEIIKFFTGNTPGGMYQLRLNGATKTLQAQVIKR